MLAARLGQVHVVRPSRALLAGRPGRPTACAHAAGLSTRKPRGKDTFAGLGGEGPPPPARLDNSSVPSSLRQFGKTLKARAVIFDWNVMTVTDHVEIIAPTHFSGWDLRHPRHQRGAAGTGPKHGAGPWLQGANAEAIAAEAAKRGLASGGTEEEQRTAVEEALRAANKAWLEP